MVIPNMTPTKNLRIAIQKNGRLRYPSLDYIVSLGLVFNPEDMDKQMVVGCLNSEIELLFVRNSDIPEYVKSGVADFGIVGENVLYERGDNLPIVKKLGFGKCDLIIASPEKSNIKSVADLNDERIATSYPNSLRKFLSENGVRASMIVINGSVEIATSLNLADAVCDITQTGNTLRCYNLIPFATILKSEAVLIESPFKSKNKELFLEKVFKKL
jgi:ATP phosphoribosyltransferase